MAASKVATLGELTDAVPHRVEVDGVPVCLVRFGDEVKAIHDTCSHQEWSLTDGGTVYGNEVECSLHGSAFDLDDGRPSSLPATRPIPTFAVEIDGDAVLLDVHAPTNDAPFPDH
ncbi:non-heme iron oxygenase ferredoxin subunit [Egicoccus halophilus]|uniref:(2Fe-2S)-binding protein n=1 Tax=Egicoccus halophilus TaxID=1670830 RepID=A0A8J3ADV9_9ACTN|nr:non-heme iron oxygenase ferredoxin subunit [Egicoccus halophilus]GGI05076.1 (2Fe-2S)-binding protein [Egicoccus halophilus]